MEKNGGSSSSKLGTKTFWDNCYQEENYNFDDHGDVGEIWFGEESMFRVINWLEDRMMVAGVGLDSPILEVGCGNGILCVELAKAGFTNITGVDYSEGAVELANKIAVKEECAIVYRSLDILDFKTVETNHRETYKIVIDKGTFDAISLSETAASDKAHYVKNVHQMLQNDGLLLITSCNWTESELLEQFSSSFTLIDSVDTTFKTFYGKTASAETFCIFKRKCKFNFTQIETK